MHASTGAGAAMAVSADDPYRAFLEAKRRHDPSTGLTGDMPALPPGMFGFQRAITSWQLRRGRSALFAGTGLGKSLMELAWAQAVHEATGCDTLHLAPLAVSAQLLREAEKFGIDARHVVTADDVGAGTNVTNYHKLERFDVSRFGAIILDESSILKSTDGHYRNELIAACQTVPFRLAATATPAPNDYMELGNHAEFLGVMSYTDMLATFFTHDGGATQKWRLKGHAEAAFWSWMASWAVMLRKPSDIGYPDDGYDLPPLHYHPHVIGASIEDAWAAGSLLQPVAQSLSERSAARRDTASARVAKAIEITPSDRPFVWWCHLNAESAALTAGIDDAVEVRGADSEADKERKLIDFSEGRIRVLVTKPSICGFGMNWQHCADTGFVGLSDSFEQFYQAVRRFWRFGQIRAVNCHIVSAESEGAVVANLRRKEADADRMAAAMVAHMSDLSAAAIRGTARAVAPYEPIAPVRLPAWLEAA